MNKDEIYTAVKRLGGTGAKVSDYDFMNILSDLTQFESPAPSDQDYDRGEIEFRGIKISRDVNMSDRCRDIVVTGVKLIDNRIPLVRYAHI